jgi:tRNA threonylcarbamoyladenosine biosynthesis protein TsaE
VKYISDSEEMTTYLGYRLGKLLKPDSIICLNGDLAAGKTTFTKGIGKALGVKRVINSPTFTLLKIYEGDLTLYHIDAYRLAENDADLGFDEYFDLGGVTVIEWYEYLKHILPKDYLEISFRLIDDRTRVINFIPHGDGYQEIIGELENDLSMY